MTGIRHTSLAIHHSETISRLGIVLMQRLSSVPRQGWQHIVESQGMHYHTLEGQPYWDESAYYSFTRAEIDGIEKATYDLNDMCVKAVDHVVEQRLFGQFGIPAAFVDWVIES